MRWRGNMTPVRFTRTRDFPMGIATFRRLIVACIVAIVLSLAAVPILRADEQKASGASGATAKKGDSVTAVSVSDVERIQFLQKNAAAQLQELQERMYRLAEMTR